jgi:TRAP-type C4-dicarboxylate transport system substrate-binding protein/dienelactone hydrolase
VCLLRPRAAVERSRAVVEQRSATVRTMHHSTHGLRLHPIRRALLTGVILVTVGACASADDTPTATPAPAPAPALITSPGTTPGTTQPSATTPATDQSVSRTLRIAHIDGGGGLEPAIEWFSAALAEHSGGALTAQFQFECCGREADNEQTLLEMVRSGGADLGWVGVRAFAQAGTTAFEPLIAPLLIRSYAAEQAVVESDVAEGLLANLEPLGLVGLGLMPGGLRYPMSTGTPLLTPADWVDQPVYSFESKAGLAAVAALGADPQHVGWDARDQGLDDGSIIGMDNTVTFQVERLELLRHMVTDVPLWTRMSVLFAAQTVSFTADEQRWIAEAVADVASRTTDLGEIDREAAREACMTGDPGYALTGPEGLAAFESTLAPVEAAIARDPDDAATLEALHELVDDVPAETPVSCPNAAELPDTSGITLRTLIEAPPETPTLSGTDAGHTGTLPVTYESGGLTITARLSMPTGSGPFPAVVLVQPFGGLERAADRLLDAGYAVLAPDLRGHGKSDPDPSQGTDLDMGSTLDTVNAVRALGREQQVDSTRIAVLGSGLGGLIAINAQVIAPEATAAVVAINPSSIDLWQNVEYYLPHDNELRELIVEQRGTPEDDPNVWADLSPATFIDRINSPLMIMQGTADTRNDPAWSDATAAVYTAAGKSAEVVVFDGADGNLDPRWEDAMATIESFLASTL